MKCAVRVKNSMHRYESDYLVNIEADNEQSALKIASQIDYYADVSIEKIEEPTMTYDQIDDLVKSELQSCIRTLCDTILLRDLDYEDSLASLDGMITALDYYSTRAEFADFIATLPEDILDILNPPETLVERMGDGICIATTSDSPLAQNLQNLGFQAVMGMVALGCTTIEELITLAKTYK